MMKWIMWQIYYMRYILNKFPFREHNIFYSKF